MSDFSAVCDWLIDDLQNNVSQLRDSIVHRYAAWDPERFIAENNDRHLAVWPSADLETAAPLTIGAHELTQTFIVAYWESASDEDERQVADEEAAASMLELHNAMRARLYKWANQTIGDTFKVWYQGAAINDATSHTRWLVLSVEVHRAKEFS